jgi:glycosyltransferase involved in cell wall biosynthesis
VINKQRSELTEKISALLITYNEELNITRTLQSLQWIPKVLVVDSGSNDRTIQIIKSYDNTQIIYRKFDTFAEQCNFGLHQLTSDWILSLDADYVLTTALSHEIYLLMSNDAQLSSCAAYNISFSYCIYGKPIRSGLLPARTCLYKRILAEYVDIGHGHKVIISGTIGRLKNKIYHDDRKPLKIWFQNQQRYQQTEALLLRKTKTTDLPIQDIVRKHTFFAPLLIFFMCILFRKGFLDGKEGLIYAFQRLTTECLLYLYLQDDNSVSR